MKKLIIPLMFSFLFIGQSFSQTVDEILSKYFETIGQEKLLKINSFTTKGKIIQGQMEIPFTSSHKRPMKFRSDATFQGMHIISAYDGDSGWTINPFAGGTDPIPLTAEQNDRMKLQADFDGMFYHYKDKGYKVKYLGTENIDDIDAYVLELTRSNGDVVKAYFDPESYVMLKTASKMKIQGVDRESETIFSNYKYTDGILHPFSIESKSNGQSVMQMTFEEFKYGVDLPDSLFEMPKVTAPTDSTKAK